MKISNDEYINKYGRAMDYWYKANIEEKSHLMAISDAKYYKTIKVKFKKCILYIMEHYIRNV